MSVKLPDSEKTKSFTLTITTSGATILGLAVVVAGVALGLGLQRNGESRVSHAGPNANAPGVATNVPGGETILGPWGELVLQAVEVEKPDAYILPAAGTVEPSVWFFRNMGLPEVGQLLARSGVTSNEIARLTAPSAVRSYTNGSIIQPGAELILGLAPETRKQLYTALSVFGENHYQAFPFTCRPDAFEKWFAASGVDAGTTALIRRLTYQRGQALCFSDLNVVLGRVAEVDQRRRVIKTLSRQSTVLMKLRIRPDTDIDKLVSYWGRGARMKDARPLIESLTHIPETATLDVVHLLPPFARRRLYTYPFPPVRPEEGGEDCHWTSMNFFSDAPDDRFRNRQTCADTLLRDYYTVTGPAQYGDVVVFMDPEGNVIHSAIYIAAEILFTKNGSSHYQPWTLMRLPDVLASYPADHPLRVVMFRDKRY